MKYCTFILSILVLQSEMSYSSEKEAKNLQNDDIHLAQILDFEMGYLENHLAH